MIKKVDITDEIKWANLCTLLFEGSTTEDMLNDLKKGRLKYEFLYYLEEKAVGFISLSLRKDYVEGSSTNLCAYIEGIYVEKEYRKRGIAREMMNFATKWALENGCSEIGSDCEINNLDSYNFHLKMGFLETSRNIHFIRKCK